MNSNKFSLFLYLNYFHPQNMKIFLGRTALVYLLSVTAAERIYNDSKLINYLTGCINKVFERSKNHTKASPSILSHNEYSKDLHSNFKSLHISEEFNGNAKKVFKYNSIINSDKLINIANHESTAKMPTDILISLFFNEELPKYLESTEMAATVDKNVVSVFNTVNYMHRVFSKLSKKDDCNILVSISYLMDAVEDIYNTYSTLKGDVDEFSKLKKVVEDYDKVSKVTTDNDFSKKRNTLSMNFIDKASDFCREMENCKKNILDLIISEELKYLVGLYIDIIINKVDIASLGFDHIINGYKNRTGELLDGLTTYATNLMLLSFFGRLGPNCHKGYIEMVRANTISPDNYDELLNNLDRDMLYSVTKRVTKINDADIKRLLDYIHSDETYKNEINISFGKKFGRFVSYIPVQIHNLLGKIPGIGKVLFSAPAIENESSIGKDEIDEERIFAEYFLENREDDFLNDDKFVGSPHLIFKQKFYSLLQDKLTLEKHIESIKIKERLLIKSEFSIDSKICYLLQMLCVCLISPIQSNIGGKLYSIGVSIDDDGFLENSRKQLISSDSKAILKKYHILCNFGISIKNLLKAFDLENMNTSSDLFFKKLMETSRSVKNVKNTINSTRIAKYSCIFLAVINIGLFITLSFSSKSDVNIEREVKKQVSGKRRRNRL